MAWTGEVRRRLVAARLVEDGDQPPIGVKYVTTPLGEFPAQSVETLECGHKQFSAFPVYRAIRQREVVCEQCSAPGRACVKEIQAGISFEDVLEKIRKLSQDDAQ